jgi:hypothetical protein
LFACHSPFVTSFSLIAILFIKQLQCSSISHRLTSMGSGHMNDLLQHYEQH